MKTKLFFTDYDDRMFTWDKTQIISTMEMNEDTEIAVFAAMREINSDYFFCNVVCEVGDKSENSCGRLCVDYLPRNGKSGICKHWGYTYECGDEYILNVNGKLTKVQ